MEFPASYLDQLNDGSLYRSVGITMESACDGVAISLMRPAAPLCWPFPGQPHGGILFTQMDTTMAIAVLASAGGEDNCATIDLGIQYPHPARGDWFRCRAEVTDRTARMRFIRAEIRDDGDRIVALGQGTFRVLGPTRSALPQA